MEGQENYAKGKARRKETLGYIFGALALVLIVGVSYAFLSVIKPEKKDFKTALSTGTMILTFADNNPTISGSIGFGDSITKKFKIINDGSLASSLSIDWNDLKNTYTNGSLVYKLNRTDESGAFQETVLEETNIPTSSVPIKQALISEVSVPSETTNYYDLVITLKDLPDVLQDADLNAMFSTGFDVGVESSYRYYTLTVDPNGGTWDTFTAPQEYQLQHNETKTGISDPTRVGYDFNGWEIKGSSSTLNAGIFTMGISDTYLVARWTPKKVTVSINVDGTVTTQEGYYEGTITLEAPTKDGYSFVGWEATGATVNGNTITITSPDSVTVRSIWSPNNYQYIVYHNKMTTSGTYAPVGVDTDKDEGEKPMDTVFQPEIRTTFGDGFKVPALKDLRITSNAENNKLTYEYERNKFQLTVDPNEGTGGTSSQEIYYEASLTLEAPTRTGYNFANWTKTAGDGTLTDGVVTMGLNGMTVQAGWTAKTMSVVLNANGGIFDNDSSITTKTTNVSYNSTYGEGTLGTLPTPARDGYEFVGWFTENSATSGTEITGATTVAIETGQMLYARWKEEQFNVPKAVTAILNNSPVVGYNSNIPNFANVATTDEGVYAMEDDYGTSYYFRGAVENNYVKFGGFYWRIIRINGDGSLRMIYDGKSYHVNGESNADRYTKTSQPFNDKSAWAEAVGYMYGGIGCTSAKDAQTNTYDSDIKIVVDEWYEKNILKSAVNNDKDLTSYLADSIFCNDRTFPAEGETWWNYQDKTHANLGWGTQMTPYGAFHRFFTISMALEVNENPAPTLKCSDNLTTGNANNDRFTVSDTEKGNADLKYPIGLITADEIVVAGSGKVGTSNNAYYLYKGASSNIWSLSPGFYNPDSYANGFYVDFDGSLGYFNAIHYSDYGAVAPVINLKAEYAQQLIGTGVKDDEYRLLGVQ